MSALVMLNWRTPNWHFDTAPFPGQGLAIDALLMASAVMVPVLLLLVTGFWRPRFVGWVLLAAAAAALAAGSSLFLLWRAGTNGRAERRLFDTLPGVASLDRGLAYTAAVGAIVLLAVLSRTRIDRWIGRPGTFVTVVAAIVVAAGGALVVAPSHRHSPNVTTYGSLQQPHHVGNAIGAGALRVPDPPRPTADEEDSSRQSGSHRRAVPVMSGLAVADGSVLTAYDTGLKRHWTVDFHSSIDGLWAPVLDHDAKQVPLVTQVHDEATAKRIVYGLDGATGRVLWTSAGFGHVLDTAFVDGSAFLLTSRDKDLRISDTGQSLSASTDVREVQATTSDLVRVGADGKAVVLWRFRPKTCAAPDRLAAFAKRLAIVEHCSFTGPRISVFDPESGFADEHYAAQALGGNITEQVDILDASTPILIAAALESPGRLSGTAALVPPDYHVSLSDVSPPDGLQIRQILSLESASVTFAAVDGQGLQVIVYRTTDEKAAVTTLVTPTRSTPSGLTGAWAPIPQTFGAAAVTAGSYRLPTKTTIGRADPQRSPTTVIGGPVYRDGIRGPRPGRVSLIASPCRQETGSANRVFPLGDGSILLWCRSAGSVAIDEMFVMPA
ncbi:hypothetical protein [Gordonia araii]|uniref:hypothetical protein n=1 Tax=Gordonia araii TaxID=263909 RepID=UPI00058FC626|nr:hypothetical protein [Gordonia araii]